MTPHAAQLTPALSTDLQRAYDNGYNSGKLVLPRIPPATEIAKRRKISLQASLAWREQWIRGHDDATATLAAEHGMRG